MSPIEIEVKRHVLKKSYYEFFKWSFRILFPEEPYSDNFHIKYICDILQQEIERIRRREQKTKDIIINVPPRTSKSLIVSVCLNAWTWIESPTFPFISVSFDETLSLLNAQYCRDIIASEEYQVLFGSSFKIRHDSDSKSFYMNSKGGFRKSTTTGSSITGHKCVVAVVDDAQNPKTSESKNMRESTTSYYTRELYNRLTPVNLGVRIIIMQRLHDSDLTGYLLRENPELYRHICLPAQVSDLVYPKNLVKYYQDGLLDPKRLSHLTLKHFKSTLGSRGFAGQYSQNPSPEEGGILKSEWFDIVRPETIVRDTINEPIHFFIDSAYTAKTENDPTSIKTAFKQGNFLYILDVQEVWLAFPDLIKYIQAHVKKFQVSPDSKLFIEPKASGLDIVNQLRAITMLNIIESKSPTQDKIVRANGIAPVIEGRRVKLVEGRYIDKFLEQIRLFPNAEHDDMVDTLGIAVNEILVKDTVDFMMLDY